MTLHARSLTLPVRGWAASPRASDLTEAEMRVLKLRAGGMTNRATAIELGIAEQTVKNHIGQCIAKFDCENVVQVLVVLGWLRVPK